MVWTKRISICLLVLIGQSGFAQDTARISLLFLGDIMQHDSQLQSAYDAVSNSYSYDDCFKFVMPYFHSADWVIGNLELTLGGKPYKGYPEFSAPDELVVAIKKAGVNVLVTANNHSVDKRKKGLERTVRVLDSLNILHTGTFRDTVDRMNDYPLLLNKNGFKLALLNYTYGTNGIPVTKPNVVNQIDTAVIRKDLQRAKELSPDATIVFMHWGNEYEHQPTKQQVNLSALCFQYGATLVIGAHPHVLQPMEWNRETNQLVVYSLGNFVSGQRVRYRNGGGMLSVELSKIINDSASVTVIDTANYILQYVHRAGDSKKSFVVLPVPSFENDTTGVLHDEASKLSFKTFVDDSRSLLNKYNKNIPELNLTPPDSTIRYKVLLMKVSESRETWNELSENYNFVYGVEEEMDDEGISWFYTGSFKNGTDAEQYRLRLSPWPESKVVKFINRRRVD